MGESSFPAKSVLERLGSTQMLTAMISLVTLMSVTILSGFELLGTTHSSACSDPFARYHHRCVRSGSLAQPYPAAAPSLASRQQPRVARIAAFHALSPRGSGFAVLARHLALSRADRPTHRFRSTGGAPSRGRDRAFHADLPRLSVSPLKSKVRVLLGGLSPRPFCEWHRGRERRAQPAAARLPCPSKPLRRRPDSIDVRSRSSACAGSRSRNSSNTSHLARGVDRPPWCLQLIGLGSTASFTPTR